TRGSLHVISGQRFHHSIFPFEGKSQLMMEEDAKLESQRRPFSVQAMGNETTSCQEQMVAFPKRSHKGPRAAIAIPHARLTARLGHRPALAEIAVCDLKLLLVR